MRSGKKIPVVNNSNNNINSMLHSDLRTRLLTGEPHSSGSDSDGEKKAKRYDSRVNIKAIISGSSNSRKPLPRSVELVETPRRNDVYVEIKSEDKQVVPVNNNRVIAVDNSVVEYEIQNRVVYYGFKWVLCPAIVLGEATFMAFCFNNVYDGMLIACQAIAEETGASLLMSMAPVAGLTAAILSTVSEFGNGMTQFELISTTQEVDTIVSKVSMRGGAHFVGNSFCSTPAKAVYVTTSLAAFAVSTAETSWGDLDDVILPSRKIFGQALGNIISGYIFLGALCYVAVGFSKRTLRGIEAWWELPHRALKERLENHGSPAVEIQYSLDITTGAIVSRGFQLGYLGMGLAEKAFNKNGTVGAGIGGISGLFQGAHFFYIGTRNAAHGGVDKRTFADLNEDRMRQNELIKKKNIILAREGKPLKRLKPLILTPINQDERNNAYKQHFGTMSYKGRLVRELKRPFCVGLTQSAIAMYAIKVWAGNAIANALISHNYTSAETTNGVLWGAAALGALIAYYPYYKFTMYVELNRIALRIRDENNPLPRALNGKVVGETTDPLLIPGSVNVPSGISIAKDELTILADDLSEQLTLIASAVKNNKTDEAMELLQNNKEKMLRVGMDSLFDNLQDQLIQRGAVVPEEKEVKAEPRANNQNEQEEDEDIQVHSKCSKYTAHLFALGMVVFRVPMMLTGYVRNPIFGNALSKFDWLMIATASGAQQGKSRYHAMVDDSQETIHKASQSLLKWISRKPKPVTVEPQPAEQKAQLSF